jgi:predicted DNA-binding ribbon-helix-helix protein
MRLANAEWRILDCICYAEKMKRKNLLELIDQKRNPELGLTAAVRLFSLRYLDSLTDKTSFGYNVAHNHHNLEMTLNMLNV